MESDAGEPASEIHTFVWPPRKVSELSQTAATTAGSLRSKPSSPSTELQESGVLVEPKVRVQSGPAAAPDQSGQVGSARVTSKPHTELCDVAPAPPTSIVNDSAWLQFQQVWLDLVTPPLAQRLSLAGWSPDAQNLYCARCGHAIGPHEASDAGCRTCLRAHLPWQRLVRLGAYEPPLSTIIHEIKFTKWRRLGTDAGRVLAASIKRQIDSQRHLLGSIMELKPVIVPVPTSMRRRIFRGIDHTRTLAHGVSSELGFEMVLALGRRHRPSQITVASHQRASNVAGTMWLKVPRERLAGRLVIVVDDVTTTGATLRAATRAIADAFRHTSSGCESGKGTTKHGINAAQDACHQRAGNKRSTGRLAPPVIWTGVLAVTEID